MEVTDYMVNKKQDGNMLIQLEENNKTDSNIQVIYNTGKFEIKDDEDETVLITNNDIKSSKVVYSNGTVNGTAVCIQIEFTKDGAKKLEEMTKKYVKTTAEDGTTTTKKVRLEVDDQELTTMSFDETNTNGILQLSVGSATTDSTKLNKYVTQAKNLSAVLAFGNLPLTYEPENNEYIASDITLEKVEKATYVLVASVMLALIVLMVKCKEKGILGAISLLGLIASILLLIRYTNVIITIEGIIAIIAMAIINYVYIFNVTQKEYKDKETFKKYNKKEFSRLINILIVIGIIGVTFSFASWEPIISLGMVLFWGIIVTIIYNLIFTRTLLINSIKQD